MMKETRWHYYAENGQRYRVKAQYGIDYPFARRNNQTPDFSVTGTIERKARNNRWYDHSGGQVTRELAAYVPEIAPYLKWHLVGPDGPRHYFANAKYWFETAQGKVEESKYPTDPIKAFTETIVLGAFPGDEPPLELENDLESEEWRPKADTTKWRGPKEWSPGNYQKQFFKGIPWSLVQAWLEERLPKLQAAWVVDMGELGVLE
jgi:hypothetical protein